MKIDDIHKVENLLNGEKIISTQLMSNSFDINCFKIKTKNKKKCIVKFYQKKNKVFNAIKSETKNLIFLNKKKLNLFPKVMQYNDNILIMEYLENNQTKPNKINRNFVEMLINLHLFSNQKYGFNFDTQIGGMQQPNKYNDNWAIFFAEKRLFVIFEAINNSNPLPNHINKQIESLILKIKDIIPEKPKPSLLHGDLWDGNILFNNKKIVGLIDPGSFYGHNEMEIAYLRWFNPNFIKGNFIEMYNEYYKVDKNYFSYEFIYQVYYSLLNVYLWDRSYISDVEKLLKKIV